VVPAPLIYSPPWPTTGTMLNTAMKRQSGRMQWLQPVYVGSLAQIARDANHSIVGESPVGMPPGKQFRASTLRPEARAPAADWKPGSWPHPGACRAARLCGDAAIAIEAQHPQQVPSGIDELHRDDADRAGG
jgi:hypothetical protein